VGASLVRPYTTADSCARQLNARRGYCRVRLLQPRRKGKTLTRICAIRSNKPWGAESKAATRRRRRDTSCRFSTLQGVSRGANFVSQGSAGTVLSKRLALKTSLPLVFLSSARRSLSSHRPCCLHSPAPKALRNRQQKRTPRVAPRSTSGRVFYPRQHHHLPVSVWTDSR